MNNLLSPQSLKLSCHNFSINSRIRSDACLFPNTATKIGSSVRTNGVNGVAVFESSPVFGKSTVSLLSCDLERFKGFATVPDRLYSYH